MSSTPTTGATSPTPRTDAQVPIQIHDKNGIPYMSDLVDADFARTLERELTEARAGYQDLAALEADKARLANTAGRGLPEDVRYFIEQVTLYLQKGDIDPEQQRAYFQKAYQLYDAYDVEGWHAKRNAALTATKEAKP